MAQVKALIALAATATGVGSPRNAPALWTNWSPLISAASARYGIPTDWIARVIQAESGGQTLHLGKVIRSRAGAMGLMQLMPATWEDMKNRYGLGNNPDDPRDNIMAGSAYLRSMYDRFGYPGLFAAYNAGPALYGAYLRHEARLPTETVLYVAALTHSQGRLLPHSAAAGVLFALQRGTANAQPLWPDAHPANLFAILVPALSAAQPDRAIPTNAQQPAAD